MNALAFICPFRWRSGQRTGIGTEDRMRPVGSVASAYAGVIVPGVGNLDGIMIPGTLLFGWQL